MRKLLSLGLVLALVESISFPAHAELLKNFKTDGSIEVRSFAIDNETDRNGSADDYRSENRTRLMLGGTFDLLDDVHARVLLSKHNRVWGNAAENGNTVQSSIIVDNAYAKIDKVFGAVDLTLGRQFYGDAEDLNIYFGPQNDDILSVTSVDLLRADASIANGWAKFTGIAGKTADTAIVADSTAGDTTVFGGEVGTDKVVPMGNLAAYYYTRQTHVAKVAGAGNNTLNVAGVRAGGDVLAGLGYMAEYIQDFGRNNTTATNTTQGPAYNGNAWFFNVHYGRELDGRPFRARAEYGRGSDDFVGIAPGRRFGLIWGEHSTQGPSTLNRQSGTVTGQTLGLSNLQVYDAGVGINPLAKLGVDVNWYRFIFDEGVTTGGKTSAGTEYDLILSWKHSDNVSFEVNAATFQVGDALQNTAPTGTSPITRLGADVKVKF